jgi:hypothetical protein
MEMASAGRRDAAVRMSACDVRTSTAGTRAIDMCGTSSSSPPSPHARMDRNQAWGRRWRFSHGHGAPCRPINEPRERVNTAGTSAAVARPPMVRTAGPANTVRRLVMRVDDRPVRCPSPGGRITPWCFGIALRCGPALSSWAVETCPVAVASCYLRSAGERWTMAPGVPNVRLKRETAALHHSDTYPHHFRRFRVDLGQFITGARKNRDIHMTCG